jgi:hypothetical protein
LVALGIYIVLVLCSGVAKYKARVIMKEKTKISSHVISATKEVIKDFFIVVFILVVPLFIWIKVGIHFENLHFKHYIVDGLYIKLDKKLTLKANEVVIPKDKAKPSFKNVEKSFNNIKNILDYFEYIELNHIKFNNNDMKIMYADDVFYITTKDYELSSIVHKNKSTIDANITSLHITKANLELIGTLSYKLKDDLLRSNGTFAFSDSNGTFKFIKNSDNVSLALSSGVFGDIEHIIKPWNIPQSIYNWLVHRVKAKQYKLDHFKLKGKLDSNANLVLDFAHIDAKAILQDVDIYFKEELPSVKTKQLDIIYDNNSLDFDMYSPTYLGRDLNSSYVKIDNLAGDKESTLYLYLHIKSVIDDKVSDILNAYDIKLPIKTLGVQTFDIDMHIPLQEDKKITTVVESNLTKDSFFISKLPLDVQNGYIKYQNNSIKLSNIRLKNSTYDIIVNGDIDTKNQKAKLNSRIKKIKVLDKYKKSIFEITNKKIPIAIDYKKELHINLATLKTKLRFINKKAIITISKLSSILPYLKKLPIKVYDGSLKITTKDFVQFKFDGMLKWNQCFFYLQKGACMSRMKASGSFSNGWLKLYAFGKKLYIDTKKSVIKLNKINIDLAKFLNAKIKKSSATNKKIYIYGNNSTIRYQNSYLLTDSYDIVVYPNGNVKAMGSLDKDIVKFDKVGKNISIKAYRVKDKMLHPLINFSGLKKGRYTLKVEGNPNKELQGEILVEGGVIKDFKAYNNTLAFINSIPALATFSEPGFSTKGYEIKEGMILYHKKSDKIYLDSIYIKGQSGNIAGHGVIDLKKRVLDISLAIQVAKDLTKVISKIPLVGYILMGDDESMTLGLKITGSLDKPKVTNTVAKDIISLPFRMLKRTFGGNSE